MPSKRERKEKKREMKDYSEILGSWKGTRIDGDEFNCKSLVVTPIICYLLLID